MDGPQAHGNTLACRLDTLQKLPCKRLMSRGFSLSTICRWNERKTVLSGLFRQKLDLLLTVLLFVLGRAFVDVFLPVPQHPIDQSRQFGGHGGKGFRRSQPGAQTAELGAQIAVAFAERARRHADRKSV